MSIDSKSMSLLSSDGVVDHDVPQPSDDTVTTAEVTAIGTRLAFFLSILAFCMWCGYEYATALFYGKDAMPPGWVGFLVVILAMVEMSMADNANRPPFYYAGKVASIPYSFFVIGGLATSCSLLYYDWQFGGVMAIHLMVFFAGTTTVLGIVMMVRYVAIYLDDISHLMQHGV